MGGGGGGVGGGREANGWVGTRGGWFELLLQGGELSALSYPCIHTPVSVRTVKHNDHAITNVFLSTHTSMHQISLTQGSYYYKINVFLSTHTSKCQNCLTHGSCYYKCISVYTHQ